MWLSGKRAFPAEGLSRVKARYPEHTWCVLKTTRMTVRLGRNELRRTGKEIRSERSKGARPQKTF